MENGVDKIQEKADNSVGGGRQVANKVPKQGDRHYREHLQMTAQTDNQLRRSARSYKQKAEEHKRYVADPTIKVSDWHTRDPRYQKGLLNHWNNEIENFETKLAWANDLLQERGL